MRWPGRCRRSGRCIAEVVNDEPEARPVLTVVVELDAVDDERLDELMPTLSQAVGEVESQPVRLLALPPAGAGVYQWLANEVRAVDDPYYRRTS